MLNEQRRCLEALSETIIRYSLIVLWESTGRLPLTAQQNLRKGYRSDNNGFDTALTSAQCSF